MSSKEICIVQDAQDNLWQFYIGQGGYFVYRIMYSESKWTKENKLDYNVEEFYIEPDDENNFHIIYVTTNGDLKYCIYKNQQWAGKTLYSFDSSMFYIRELGLILLKKEIHVTFIFCRNDQKEKGILTHYLWSEGEGVSSNIYTIYLLPSTDRHYTLEVASESVLYIFFLTRENSEAVLMNCGYINRLWSKPKKLYGITGENIEIFTLEKNNEFNILNVSKEGSSVLLERAFIDYQGNIKSEIIYETKEKVVGANLLMFNGTLWAQWLQDDNNINYSYFDEKWKTVESLYEEYANIEIYRYKRLKTRMNNLNIKVVFGSAYPDLQLYFPKAVDGKKDKNFLSELREKNKVSINSEENSLFSKTNKQPADDLINVLQERIAKLQIQIQLKNRTIEQPDAISQPKAEKKMTEEMIGKMESLNIKLQLAMEKLNGYMEDNEKLNKEVDRLKCINNLLKEELKEERNKSILSRLLKKSN